MTTVHTQLGGLLGTAVQASRTGRLHHFIAGAHSPAIALFAREVAQANLEGDWYGEHAGKWLIAAARAAARDGDAPLAARVREVADFLVQQQEPDGYLGTYAPQRRFMVPQPPKPGTWDGAPSVRTWDIWTHSYLILGLLEAHRHWPTPRWLAAACRIGDLCWHTLARDEKDGGIDINDLGNHHGLSATVLMDPAVELHWASGQQRYLDLALRVLQQADANPALALLRRAQAGVDAADIATGKAYQLAWNLVGLAKLHRATGRPDLRAAIDALWHSIRQHHITLGGGPWGGVALRSRECFNPPGVFSPQGYVETCSTLAWMQLNRELLAITGDARHADAIECSAYNDLLGALAPNGEDWCYYSFPNGRRVHTTTWRCCKSSGAMALEELPDSACTQRMPGSVDINLFGPATTRIELPDGATLRLTQVTGYPFDGAIALHVEPQAPTPCVLRVRCPAWAHGASMQVNGQPVVCARGSYTVFDRTWSPGDRIDIAFPMPVVTHRRVNANIQESKAPDGSPVRQQVLHDAYLAITRGPLVYATGLVDGYKAGDTIRPPQADDDTWLTVLPTAPGDEGPAIRMARDGASPLHFTPYYRTGGRVDGAWRLTWLSVAPDDAAPVATDKIP